MKVNKIIKLVCIDSHSRFKYRRFGQQGGSGQNRFGVQEEEGGFGEDRGSMELRWMRESVRDEESEQGIYKRRKQQDRKGNRVNQIYQKRVRGEDRDRT